LETNRPLRFDLLFLQDYLEYDTFIFANVQSLNKYFELIKADKNFISAKFIFFVETWTLSGDQYDIEGYKCIYRQGCVGEKKFAYGSHIYMKEMYNSLPEVLFESNIHNSKKITTYPIIL